MNEKRCKECGKIPCEHYNLLTQFPDLVKNEWMYEKNERGPETYGPRSGQKVWWKCRKNPCGCHTWKATISNRTAQNKPRGCPFCRISGRYCAHNNFAFCYPEVVKKYWDWEKNTILPTEISPKSGIKVYLKCNGCEFGCHKWSTNISDLANGAGCPFCNHSVKICIHNNFATKFPHIAKEFDINKNIRKPETFAPCSSIVVWWLCQKCNNSWKTSIGNRTNGHNGCPQCNTINQSKLSSYLFTHIKTNYPKLQFELEKVLVGCKYKSHLRFDVYIKSLNLIIEMDGKQHFHTTGFITNNILDETQYRDFIKTQYVFDKKINLLRVSYIELKNIKEIFDYVINFIKNKKDNDPIFFYNISCRLNLQYRKGKQYVVDDVYEDHENIFDSNCYIDAGHRQLKYIDENGNDYYFD